MEAGKLGGGEEAHLSSLRWLFRSSSPHACSFGGTFALLDVTVVMLEGGGDVYYMILVAWDRCWVCTMITVLRERLSL